MDPNKPDNFWTHNLTSGTATSMSLQPWHLLLIFGTIAVMLFLACGSVWNPSCHP